MKSIGDKRITIKLREEKDISIEVLVEAIKSLVIIIIAMLQEEEVMILKEAILQRSWVPITIPMYNVYCVV